MAAIPTHQVLFTTELLEEILLRTPPKDVLLLQRLCKGWKDVIEGSVKLQRMLFFLPIGPVENDPESEFILNLMAASVHSQILPCLGRYNRGDFSARMSARKNDPIFHENASWKPMFLSQPPFQKLTLRSNPQVDSHRDFSWSKESTHRAGTTMEDLFQQWGVVGAELDFESVLGWLQEFEAYAQLERSSK